jgi:peroxiredoxin family protein
MTVAEAPVVPAAETEPAAEPEPETRQQGIAIICYSGDLEKTWAAMILASTSASLGMPTKVFVTFWGLQTFVRNERRITGQNWMQKMLSFMSRPGIKHRKMSKMNFLGMGPWMMFKLAKQYGVSTPAELLEVAEMMGVEFIPCQMTMDMFGLTRDDLLPGMGEPVGAASYLADVASGLSPIFI